MRSIGFDEAELRWVWTLCAVILILGNIDFREAGEETKVQARPCFWPGLHGLSDAATQVTDPAIIKEISALLCCDHVALCSALTTRRIKAGSDWIVSPVTAEVAANMRDGLAKAIYQRVFSWMVMRVNTNLAILQSEDGLSRARFFIGILDIFGFEMFEVNSLEQVRLLAR